MYYTAYVHREDDALLATFPDCPGCQTFSREGKEHLARMAAEALSGWLEAHLVDGEAPPCPKEHRRAPGGRKLLHVPVEPGVAVAVQLRQARAELGLTQRELASRAGVSQQMIAKLERPAENPSLRTVQKVARALKRTVDVALVAAG